VRTIKVNLQQILAGDETCDITLEPNDHVFVRKTPGWRMHQLVRVNGEVKFPGFYAIVEDSTSLSQIIHQAGDFTEDALIREMRLIRERKTIVEDKEYTRLAGMARADMSDSEYEYFVMKQNSGDINEVVVDFYKLFVKNDAAEDIMLKDGDIIHVPKRPNVVYVTGRVSNSGGILFKTGGNARYYIQKAGGFTWDADRSRVKVIKVNGEIKNMDSVKSLEAGDRIWVPRKKEMNYWQVFRDFVMVMGQLATVYLVVRTATR
jgi:protein involved in polysaccharide export with SLBB domain